MTEPGQTDDYSVADHINAIIEHCGEGLIDYCIYDTGEVIPEFIRKYNREGADLVDQDLDNCMDKKVKFLKENLSVITDDSIRHNANLISDVAIKLICDDLRFRDKQNDPEYLMMNTKLKEDKRINKQKKKALKSKNNDKESNSILIKEKGKKSKFAAKYSDRIESIKNADMKAMQRKKNIEAKNNAQRKKTREDTKEEIEARRNALRKKEEMAKKKASSKPSTKTSSNSEKNIKINHKTLRPEDYEKIRKEMIEKFNNSKLKD